MTLEGPRVRLEPLSLAHAPSLFAIGSDPSIWEYLAYEPFRKLEDAYAYVHEALRRATNNAELPFAVIDRSDERLAGTTRYYDINAHNRGLAIGWTWYGVVFQRTAINTETKILLLDHAFESLGAIRVQITADVRNLRSRRAIERLGASFEGILRNHMILPGSGFIRDTAVYSILDTEWPRAKACLQERSRRF